ncbi:MAG: ABC transporter permease, partial [Anaerolineales bacterium]
DKMGPLLRQHLYSSVRRNRFFWQLFAYLAGVGIVTLLFSLVVVMGVVNTSYGDETTISMLSLFQQGRSFYWFFSVILLLTTMLLVPIGAVGAIAGERENRTWDLLRTTTLRIRDIVLGKVSATLLTGLLYVMAPLPLLMTSFWLGGVTQTELILTFSLLSVTMMLYIARALFISSLVRKTITAVVIYYGLNLAAIPLIVALAVAITALVNSLTYGSSQFPMQAYWLEVAMQHGWVILIGANPITTAIATEALGLEQGSWVLHTFDVIERIETGRGPVIGSVTLPSPWITFTLFSLIRIGVLLWLTTRRLNRKER